MGGESFRAEKQDRRTDGRTDMMNLAVVLRSFGRPKLRSPTFI